MLRFKKFQQLKGSHEAAVHPRAVWGQSAEVLNYSLIIRAIPISLEETKHKAKSLFQMSKEKLENKSEEEEKETFMASQGWWEKFSKRNGRGSVKLLGEAASADTEAAERYPPKLKQII